MVHFKSGVMLVYTDRLSANADVTLECPKNALLLILQRNLDGLQKAAKIEGNMEYISLIIDNITEFSFSSPANFNLIEP